MVCVACICVWGWTGRVGEGGEGERGVGRVGEKHIPAMRNRAMGHDRLKQGSTAFIHVVSCVVYVCRAAIVAYC